MDSVNNFAKLTNGSTLANVRIDAPCDRPRVAMYSHDTMGIGHVRRNLLIAQRLAGDPMHSDVLLLTGALEAGAFAAPPGVDCLTLPAISKDLAGSYRPRRSTILFQELIELRSRVLQAAVEGFAPDVLIVDKVPRGVGGELNATLAYCRERGRPKCVLGLRDVLDAPDVVQEEWARNSNEEAIREYYDAVWIYGDPQVYDAVREYGFTASTAAKTYYVGYLDQRQRLAIGTPCDAGLDLPAERLVLCIVGGGQDGADLADAFLRTELPDGAFGVLVSGPYMPADAQRRLHDLARQTPRKRVLNFVQEPDSLVARADHVITMGGYNSVCSSLSFGKRTLVVPRVRPRREQAIRAERLNALGLLDVLTWDDISPRCLAEWIRSESPPPATHSEVDLMGLERLPGLLRDVLGGNSRRSALHLERKEVCNAAG